MNKQTKELIEHWRSIGPVAWAEGPYGWVGENNQPVELTPWQRAALNVWWTYRVFVTTLAFSNTKKTGKTFLNAVLLCWRWLALPGEHFAAANDLDQSAGRQFQQIAEMIKRNPYLSQNTRVTNRQIVFIPSGSTITALAVDAAGNAGSNHLTASHTETWGIIYEAGIRAYEELTVPPGKSYGLPALRIADSYAGYLGESETWHNLVDRGIKGERVSEDWPIFLAGGLLLFHMEGVEAQERCFRGTPEEAKSYYKEQESSLRALAYQRLHLNTRTTNESAFISTEQWSACYSPEVRPLVVGDRRRIVLAGDASTSRDLTALVGVAYDQETKLVDVVYARAWKPQRGLYRLGKPTVDLDETIKPEILRLHAAGNVAACYYDPYQLHSIGLSLEKAGVRMLELPQTTARIASDQSLYDAIIARTVRHYGDPVLTEHALAAIALDTARGFRIAKEKTSAKIDLMVALSMAHYGALQELGKPLGELVVSPNPFFGGSLDGQKVQNSAEFIKHPLYDNAGRFRGPHANPSTTFDTCWHYKHGPGCIPCSQAVMQYRAEQRRLAREEMAENDRELARKIFG